MGVLKSLLSCYFTMDGLRLIYLGFESPRDREELLKPCFKVLLGSLSQEPSLVLNRIELLLKGNARPQRQSGDEGNKVWKEACMHFLD